MIKSEEKIIMKAIALCYEQCLKPEEAMIYCNLGRSQFAKMPGFWYTQKQ